MAVKGVITTQRFRNATNPCLLGGVIKFRPIAVKLEHFKFTLLDPSIPAGAEDTETYYLRISNLTNWQLVSRSRIFKVIYIIRSDESSRDKA